MKLLTMMPVLFALSAQGQVTARFEAMNYQGIARNAAGEPVANQTVGLLFQLVYGLSSAYAETNTATTDAFGVFNVQIGTGTYQYGDATTFNAIDWWNAEMWQLSVGIDITGGTNYQIVGYQSLLASPFAAYAREALTLKFNPWTDQGAAVTTTGHNVGLGVTTPVNQLDVEGGAVIGANYSGTNTAPANGLLVQGAVAINATSPGAFTLLCNGSAAKPGGGSWSTSSDRRLKRNIAPLKGALNTLLSLHGVEFEYIDAASIHELAGRRMGFIAQDVEQVIPDWVSDVDGYKRLTIRGFEALAVESMRELEAQNAAMRKELDALHAERQVLGAAIERLNARLETMETRDAPAKAQR